MADVEANWEMRDTLSWFGGRDDACRRTVLLVKALAPAISETMPSNFSCHKTG